MKKMILLVSMFFVVGCSDPMELVIPEYQCDRDHDSQYISTIKKLEGHDRAMVNAYIGRCGLYRDRLGGVTIGKAIEIMEKNGYGR